MITQDHFSIYKFMVNNFGGNKYESFEQFKAAVIDGRVTKRFVPSKAWGVYDIDRKKIISEGFLCRYGFDLIKVSQGVVTEYYRRLLVNKKYCFVSYDLVSMEMLEGYRNVDEKLCKFNLDNNENIQVNINCSYYELPEDFKIAVKDLVHKNNIFMYAIKPYGRVVEFYYSKY